MAAVLWLVFAFPWHPKSPLGWALLFLLALPMTLAGEFVGDKLLNSRPGRYVEKKTKHKSFSCLRIVYVLAVSLTAISAVVGFVLLWKGLN